MHYPYENLDSYTLPKLLARSLALYKHNPFCGYVDEACISYQEFAQRVDATKNLLKHSGITKGDKVLLLSQNMPNWGVAYFAITALGAVGVPVLTDFHASEIHHIIRHSEAKAAFCSQKFIQIIEDCADAHLHFVIDLETLQEIPELTCHTRLENLRHKVKELKEKFQKHEIYEPKEDDLAVIIYTSGTTGHSKGVMLSHKNLVTNAMSTHGVIQILPQDIFLSILPLAHTFECTVGLIVPLLHGSSLFYVQKTPTPTVLLKAFESVRPTMMLSVPLVIEKIYKTRVLTKINDSALTRNLYKIPFFRRQLNKIAGKKLHETFGGRLRFYGVGGAALPLYVEEFLYESGFPYTVGYGLTETAPLLAGTPIHMQTKLKSTGLAVHGVELKLININSVTGEGEIAAKSPSVMMGYYKDEAKTAEVFDADGWFLTGDLGTIDKDGYLFISGRSKNVIIGSSGENIYPEQLESIINQNPTVLDALVLEQEGKLIARINLDYEMIDKLFDATHTPDSRIQEQISKHLEELRMHYNTQVASFSKITKFIEQREPFVKTPTKKIKRYLYAN